MTITPLAPRTPYIAVPAGSCTTSIDAISRGLMALRLAPCAMSTGTSSTIHRGWLFDMKELTPRIRTERPPSAVSVTDTPGKRSLKSCASERPGARSISSDVMTEWGTALAGATPSARPSPVAFFWWEQATAKPSSNPSSRWAWAEHMGDLLRIMGSLTRALGLDDDDAVGAAQAIQRRLGGLLQHFDRFDVVGVDPRQVALGTRIDDHTVQHVQRGVVAPDGRAATDADRKATVGRPAHLHAGKATHQQLLDRLPGCLGDVLRRHGRAGSGGGGGRRRGGGWLVPMSATGTKCDEKADRQQGAHRERDHWTPPMTRYVSIYGMARLAANP